MARAACAAPSGMLPHGAVPPTLRGGGHRRISTAVSPRVVLLLALLSTADAFAPLRPALQTAPTTLLRVGCARSPAIGLDAKRGAPLKGFFGELFDGARDEDGTSSAWVKPGSENPVTGAYCNIVQTVAWRRRDLGASPGADSDAAVLARTAAGAVVETAVLLAVLMGAAALPASASGALVAAEWLAWVGVIFVSSAIGIALPRMLLAAGGRGGDALDRPTSATRQLLMPTAVSGNPKWCARARSSSRDPPIPRHVPPSW